MPGPSLCLRYPYLHTCSHQGSFNLLAHVSSNLFWAEEQELWRPCLVLVERASKTLRKCPPVHGVLVRPSTLRRASGWRVDQGSQQLWRSVILIWGKVLARCDRWLTGGQLALGITIPNPSFESSACLWKRACALVHFLAVIAALAGSAPYCFSSAPQGHTGWHQLPLHSADPHPTLAGSRWPLSG